MRKATAIACVLVDVGGVLLTDGWDHHARKRAARTFNLKWAEMEQRHVLTFETYEEGKLTLEEYLGQVVFYQRRTQRVSDSQVQAGQSVGTVAKWSASVIVALSFLTPRKILGKSATFWWYKAVIHASC
jgi:hypothetical protein